MGKMKERIFSIPLITRDFLSQQFSEDWDESIVKDINNIESLHKVITKEIVDNCSFYCCGSASTEVLFNNVAQIGEYLKHTDKLMCNPFTFPSDAEKIVTNYILDYSLYLLKEFTPEDIKEKLKTINVDNYKSIFNEIWEFFEYNKNPEVLTDNPIQWYNGEAYEG